MTSTLWKHIVVSPNFSTRPHIFFTDGCELYSFVVQNGRYDFKNFTQSLRSVDCFCNCRARGTSSGRWKYNHKHGGSHIAKRNFLIVSVHVSLIKIVLESFRTHTSLQFCFSFENLKMSTSTLTDSPCCCWKYNSEEVFLHPNLSNAGLLFFRKSDAAR